MVLPITEKPLMQKPQVLSIVGGKKSSLTHSDTVFISVLNWCYWVFLRFKKKWFIYTGILIFEVFYLSFCCRICIRYMYCSDLNTAILLAHEVAFPSRICVFSCMNICYGSENLFYGNSIGTAFISNCIRVHPAVLQLKLAGTWPSPCTFF
jgi:hypothetical protein